MPVLKVEQETYWADHPNPAVLASLIEQESCISLKHSKCWNPQSRLKTSIEEGAGFGQITRAYKSNGSLRFDALQEQVNKHSELAGWNWANVYSRPDLQLRSIVLMNRDNYWSVLRMGVPKEQALPFVDAAYNGGVGGVANDRRLCALTKGCNSSVWFGQVEKTCTKSKASKGPAYGNKSNCDINREHVTYVFGIRLPKYSTWWRNQNGN